MRDRWREQKAAEGRKLKKSLWETEEDEANEEKKKKLKEDKKGLLTRDNYEISEDKQTE